MSPRRTSIAITDASGKISQTPMKGLMKKVSPAQATAAAMFVRAAQ
jgi:hypothetical protein